MPLTLHYKVAAKHIFIKVRHFAEPFFVEFGGDQVLLKF
jgi:hypothetical protein